MNQSPQQILAVFMICAATSLACNAERVEIPDPPAESGKRPSSPREEPVGWVAPPYPDTSPPVEPSTPIVRTVGTLGGLVDFDFDDDTLVLVGEDSVHACPRDACAATRKIEGLALAPGGFALAGSRIYFDDARDDDVHELASVALDGTSRRTEATSAPFSARATFFAFHGGDTVSALVRRVPILDGGRFEHVFLGAAARNGARTGRVTANVHTNGAARVESIPAERPSLVSSTGWRFRVVGADAPAPEGEPIAIGTSPFETAAGDVAHPTVVVRLGDHLAACSFVGRRCGGFVDLGPIRGTFTLDAERLYVGNEERLASCTLLEIAGGACTLDTIVDEPASAPLYATRDEIFFAHGSDVRAARIPGR